MKSSLFIETPRFTVRSYGNGLAYTLLHRGLGQDILFQGDDAEVFRRSLMSLTENDSPGPVLDYDQALGVLWEEYEALATRVVGVTRSDLGLPICDGAQGYAKLVDEIAGVDPEDLSKGKYEKLQCPQCGGDCVGYEAYSTYDSVTEEMVLGGEYDDGWCNDCGDVTPEMVPITDPDEIAAIDKERAALAFLKKMRAEFEKGWVKS